MFWVVVKREIIEESDDRAEFLSGCPTEWLFLNLVTAGTSAVGGLLLVVAPVRIREERAEDVAESVPGHQFPGLLFRASDCVESPVKAIPRPRFHQLVVEAALGGGAGFARGAVGWRINVGGGDPRFAVWASSAAAETDIVGTSGMDSSELVPLMCPLGSSSDNFVAGADPATPCPSSCSSSLRSGPWVCKLSHPTTGAAGSRGGWAGLAGPPCEDPELSMMC